VQLGRRAFSTDLFVPRVTERRLTEQGPGGRATNAGVKVAVFGATGFLGKHVCNQLGTKYRILLNNLVV
jgi:NADH dehydrogenase (ubiquinone) 1 alpha subcomplex subunit 9